MVILIMQELVQIMLKLFYQRALCGSYGSPMRSSCYRNNKLRDKINDILTYATFSKIRVLAYDEANWIIDPQVDAIKEHWKLRVFEKKPLIRLQWDPGEFWWKDPFDCGKKVWFFSILS